MIQKISMEGMRKLCSASIKLAVKDRDAYIKRLSEYGEASPYLAKSFESACDFLYVMEQLQQVLPDFIQSWS